MPTTTDTQYSIYKINFEAVENVFIDISRGNNLKEYATNIISVLIKSIEKNVSAKCSNAEIHTIKYQGLRGVVFKTIHSPTWDGVARQILNNNEEPSKREISKGFLNNTNVSYVYFYLCEEKIYAVTGGYGSNYITKFVEKNFGLYLLPKLIEKDNSVIKAVFQNNLQGNQTTSNRTNKNSTSIQVEQDMSSIFRQLSIEASREIAETLGVKFEEGESENKKINIVNKDSIVIHRSISLTELKKIIKNIYVIEKRKDKFALNYLVLAKKKGYTNPALNSVLIETILAEKTSNFVITGDDYTVFITGSSKYVVKDTTSQKIIIDKEEPVQFSEIIDILKQKSLSKTSISHMLKKWEIATYDNSGNPVLYPIPLYDAIQGFIEYGEDRIPFYLFNGQWYVFDSQFAKILNDEFKNLYINQAELRKKYSSEFDLVKNECTEESYNANIKASRKHLVTHTVLMNYVEIADVIIFKDNQLFLMHNKGKFNGSGTRDVVNQVLTSAAYLQQILSSPHKNDFLEEYYKSIEKSYKKDKITIPIDKDTFKQYFDGSHKINYLLGFIDNYTQASQSTYAKYLVVEAYKKLANKGYACVPLLIRKQN